MKNDENSVTPYPPGAGKRRANLRLDSLEDVRRELARTYRRLTSKNRETKEFNLDPQRARTAIYALATAIHIFEADRDAKIAQLEEEAVAMRKQVEALLQEVRERTAATKTT